MRSTFPVWRCRFPTVQCHFLPRRPRITPIIATPPASSLMQRDNVQHVRDALKRLTPEQRTIVQKKIYEEKTFADIAAELGIPLGTVLTRMRKALQILRRELEPHE